MSRKSFKAWGKEYPVEVQDYLVAVHNQNLAYFMEDKESYLYWEEVIHATCTPMDADTFSCLHKVMRKPFWMEET